MKRLSLFLIVLTATLLQVVAQSRNYLRTSEIDKKVYWWCALEKYKPHDDTKVKLTFRYHATNDNADQNILGTQTEIGGVVYNRFKITIKNSFLTAYVGISNAAYVADKVKLVDGAVYVVTLDKNEFVVDKDFDKVQNHDQVVEIGVGTFNNNVLPLPSTFCIGKCHGSEVGSCIDIYRCQILDNGKLKRDYIPAKSGDKYGLRNLCDGQYVSSDSQIGQVNDCEDHKYMEVLEKEADGKLYGHCLTCDEKFEIKNWKQEEEMGVSLLQPYLDVQADLCDAGNVKSYISSTNSIARFWLMDDDTGELLMFKDFSSSPSSGVDLSLPKTERAVKASLVLDVLAQNTLDNMIYKDKQTAVVHFDYKPYHSIKGITFNEFPNPDSSSGMMQPATEIRWYVENPDDEDIMSSDQFVVVRSTDPEFSYYETVGSASLSKFDKKETLEDGTKIGWFSVIDDTEENQLNKNDNGDKTLYLNEDIEKKIDESLYLSDLDRAALKGFYSHPSKKMYYRVSRAVAMSMWPNHRGDYIVEDSVHTNSTLPAVTRIKVEPSANWSNDKKVTVRIELQNPYPWEYNAVSDVQAIRKFAEETKLDYRRYRWDDGAKIVVNRFSPAEDYMTDGTDAIARTYTISGSDVTWDNDHGVWYAELKDCQSLPYTHYYYSAKIDGSNSDFIETALNETMTISKEQADLSYSESAALIGDFVASRDLVGKVNVHWTLGNGGVDKLTLERREYSRDGNGEWESVSIANGDEEYNDTKAQPGHVEEYRLTATFIYRGKTYTSVKTAMGYPTYRGKLAGRVVMPNGVGIAGAKIQVKRIYPTYISIEDVYDAEGNLVMKGAQEGIVADAPMRREAEDVKEENVVIDPTSFNTNIVTDETGAFELDNVLFSCVDGQSTQYVLSVSYGSSSFSFAGSNEPATVSLNNDQPEKTGIVFTCTTYKTMSGYVYYKTSTVPVRDVTFSMTYNGETSMFKNADGSAVKTDANGYYSILVPNAKVAVAMNKNGHKFENDGYLLGSAKDAVTYNENENYEEVKTYDVTKTRLVGRLSGGNVEANKPLGFSLSKNNLGDNATIVLQLEGDNSSQIVYDIDRPEITKVDSVMKHPFTGLYPDYKAQTNVTYERKRIVIHPDPVTGEFFVDLFPTKYKVTQLSCDGYSTLYRSGEGLDVIDFSDSTQTRVVTLNGQELKLEASYVRAYHKDATVTYEQYVHGQFTGYLGDETISEMNLEGTEVEATVASYDKEKKRASYLFDYPVFSTGKKYTLQVRAHEDYYYNNDMSKALDEVHLDGGTLIVQNGLLDNNVREEYPLDSNGMATFVFEAGNTTFTQKDEDALRYMNISVKLNDYYYEANSLKAFVTGYRDKNTDVIAYDDNLTVVDVIRDPYGAGSSSWIDSGVSYEWDREFEFKAGFSLKITPSIGASGSALVGAFVGMGGGAWTGTSYSTKSTFALAVNVPVFSMTKKVKAHYALTTSKKISTSEDPYDIGAMADVYVGTVHTSQMNTAETFSLIDQTTYNAVKGAIDRGTIRVVKEGKDDKGNNFYLVIAEKMHMTVDNSLREFAYSQSHILGVIIPTLIDARANLLVHTEDKATVEAMAKNSKEVKYWSSVSADDKNFGLANTYIMYNESGKPAVDQIQKINNMLALWTKAVKANEQVKIDHMNDTKNVTRYSIAGSDVEYSDEYAANYSNKWTPNLLFWNLNNGNWAVDANVSFPDPTDKGAGKDWAEKVNEAKEAAASNPTQKVDTQVEAPGFKFDFEMEPSLELSLSDTESGSKVYNAKRGYSIKTNDNSYFDIDVVKVLNEDARKQYLDYDKETTDWVLTDDDKKNTGQFSSFLFYLRGGAVRNPYFVSDSTIFAAKDGQRVALGTNPLKIDNPKIYIEQPVVNNQPEDETATFTVHLMNESELGQNVKYLKPSKFTLAVDDASNPYGAKFTIDGEPLTDGQDFYIQPGETLVKTIEVARGKGYDFQNIKLQFMDATAILSDEANISINYLPMATNVRITSPTDKWVMNTLSAFDEKGRYFIPVNIDGFNANSDGFHHIELQYKKQTEGDSQWVTFKSFYSDSTFFNKATGEKEMIPYTGKIGNVKFYGENDPIEMKYDLRAVAFRSVGTGFVTRASSVMSGIKDTRCPEVFGMPKPTDGVLGFDDVISIPFNEPIAYNYLNATSNFQIVGYLNDADTKYSTSLRFDFRNDPDVVVSDYGEQIPRSKIFRNLTENDFTLDMMAKCSAENTNMFFAMVDDTQYNENNNEYSNSYLVFYLLKKQFHLVINGIVFDSEEMDESISLKDNFTHIGVALKQESATGGPEVTFYVGDTELATKSITNAANESVSDPNTIELGVIRGKVELGALMNGSLVDVRLWDKALNHGEFMSKKNKRFSKNEPNLYAYWPIDEGTGNVLFDKVNGCDLHVTNPRWEMPDGQHSLKVSGEPVKVVDHAAEKFGKQSYSDFTLSFWFRVGEETELSSNTLSIFKAGNETDAQYFRLGIDNASLSLTSAKKSFQIMPSDGLKGAWHNVILIANKSQNASCVYIDGKLTTTINAEDIAGMANYAVQFGDDGYYGNYDNLTFWNLAFPSNCISQIYRMAPTGHEMGLVYYLPFEADKQINGKNHTEFSPCNMSYIDIQDNGVLSGKDKLDGTDMFELDEDRLRSISDDQNYSPVHVATGLANIPFSWTATDNELQINIKKADRDINHQTLNITVRNVEDLQGNVLVNPQMMMVYVNRNALLWDDPSDNSEVPYGEEKTLYATFNNISGRSVSYNLESNCSWLKIDESVGIASPLQRAVLEMKVSSELAPGDYTTTVYLVDENGLSAPLPVNITVVADAPEWNVTTDVDYQYTMNVMGQVKLLNAGGSEYYDTDERDIVAAFYDGVCVGKANVKKNDAGVPFVYLTIKGNTNMLPKTYKGETTYKEISFQIWNAQTNEVFVLVPQNEAERINFTNNGVVGCPPESPVIFMPSNEILQKIPFNAGWNWLSFNVTPKNDKGVNYLFQNVNVFSVGDRIVYVNNKGNRVTSELVLDENGDKQWNNGIDGIDNNLHHVYQLYAQQAGILTVLGYRISEKNRVVNVVPNQTDPTKGQWNELAYLLEMDQPINTAMSGYADGRTVTGTVIKSLKEFAVADNNHKWVGSLEAMHPGLGYYTKCISTTKATIPIDYSNVDIDRNAKSRKAAAKSTRGVVAEDNGLDLILNESAEYPTMMPVIAVEGEGAEYEEGDEIVAYANGEIAGRAKAIELDNGEKRFFISVNAEEGASVRFALLRNGEVESKSGNGIMYDSNVICGTLDAPFAIDFTQKASEDVYDINGIKYNSADDINSRGVFIINGEKRMK